MTDSKIISLLDTTHPPGLGRGGFRISLTHHGGLIYDEEENMILDDIELTYVNPVGPFKKWVEVSATVKTREHKYWLFCKDEFWGAATVDFTINRYLYPFLAVLRRFSNGLIPELEVTSCFGYKSFARIESYSPEESSFFSSWVEYIKKYNPSIYGGSLI